MRLPSLLPLGLAILTGCSEKPARVQCHPAMGTILVDGQPADGVRVMMYPSGKIGSFDVLKPIATTKSNGKFLMGTYAKGDGAPVGTYKVTLYYPEALPTGSNAPRDQLGGLYIDPSKSTIDAKIVEGENQLPTIEVKKLTKLFPSAPISTRPNPDNDGR